MVDPADGLKEVLGQLLVVALVLLESMVENQVGDLKS